MAARAGREAEYAETTKPLRNFTKVKLKSQGNQKYWENLQAAEAVLDGTYLTTDWTAEEEGSP